MVITMRTCHAVQKGLDESPPEPFSLVVAGNRSLRCSDGEGGMRAAWRHDSTASTTGASSLGSGPMGKRLAVAVARSGRRRMKPSP